MIDASAAVEWLLRLPLGPPVEERISRADTLHAPHLLAVEVAQVIRRYVLSGQIRPDRGAEAIADLADLDVDHHPHEPLLPTMWRLHRNLSAYDAAYVSLAEVLEAPLLTLDAGIAAAPGHRAVVDLVR
ncbi:MAG: type II toxin-antitoxin system VapC family toxin [Actinomycetota bacterium]|nr:type II toxin-antitoxin system VapC family toxin [Actinomycetota bacterium]